MSFNRSFNWNYNNRGRGGRGGRGPGRGGFDRGPRGSWARNNYRDPSQYNSKPYWSNWNQDYSGPANRHMNQQWQNRSKRDTPGERLSEEDIGVTEYISDHEGFSGIIKSRYSDFQVSEINDDGQVAKLTDENPPTPLDETVDEDEDLLLTKYNLEILPMDTWDSINKLVVSKGDPTDKVEVDVTGMSKEQRTKIHDAVKKAFGDGIVGSTVNENDKKIVRFVRYRRGVRIDNRVKWTWPGEYVYFIVHKENCDTMDAANSIVEKLRINMKTSMFGYAGTKDRRAKTSQWFSVRRLDPRKIHAAVMHAPRIRAGNYSFHARPLTLGMLQGNKFRIALRNVTADEASVSAACELLRTRGFLNYYGLQRFGTRRRSPTYNAGMMLLRGDFKQAVDCILSSASDRSAPHEAWMLNVLARSPKDFLGAIQKVPRNTRLLYLHAYQSWVWNQALSRRLQRYGQRPAPGDLVPLADLQQQLEEDESDEEEQLNEKQEQNTSEKDDKLESESEGQKEKEEEKDKEKEKERKRQNIDTPKPKVPVKVLTQEDVDSGAYTIFDIVLPLPGYNVDYPPNMKDYYEELVKKDGLTLELRNKIKVFSMAGAYRHIVARPRDLAWDIVRYSDPHADLLLSDADELDGRTHTGILEDGQYKALLLTMSLPASCYATMALRELLKVDTSSDNQALKNNYYKRKREDSKTEDAADKTNNKNGAKTEDAADKTHNKNGEEKSEKEMAVDESSCGKETEDSGELEDTECTEAKKAKTDDSGQ